MEQPKMRDWTPGCYGLRYPATVAGADAVIYRWRERNDHYIPYGPRDYDILVGTRGPGRWEAGLPILTFGGFIDPTDESPWHAVARELREELGDQMVVEIAPTPFFVTGPVKYRHIWDAKTQKAVSLNKLAQDIPAITLVYKARWRSGEPQPTKEVPEATWVNLRELLTEAREFAFDHARVLGELLRTI